ncbi:MAG: FHA domain-containing protein [Gammaproteobacteria bacterium]|nr:FHA domain-containing protein [Gammaproteobacteria bacterium]NVK89008.1 FHA domain-containing protein [Gammaproteobacteria bacterium]
MSLVIEEINRSKKTIQRYKFNQQPIIRVGRALDNDVILNEPHVSPYHLELRQQEDGDWVVIDLDSTNGIRNKKRKMIASGSSIKSGDTLLLGRSYISLWDEKHPVEEAWRLHSVEDVLHFISHPFSVLLLLLLFVFGEWQLTVAQQYREVAPSRIMNDLIYQLIVVFGWASLWSINGRMLRHDSRFLSHLAVTLLAAMVYQWMPWAIRMITFNLHSGTWFTEVRYFINGGIFSLLLWCNFYLALPQKPIKRVIWVNAIAWSLVLLYLLPPLFDTQGFRGYPRYDSSILPGQVLLSTPKTKADFMADTQALYQQQTKPLEAPHSPKPE